MRRLHNDGYVPYTYHDDFDVIIASYIYLGCDGTLC